MYHNNVKLLEIIEIIFDHDLERREDFQKNVLMQIKDVDKEGEIYKRIFFLLSRVDFSTDEAVIHWDNVVEHKDELQSQLERAVSFRVAMLDYLLSNGLISQNPGVIQLYIYESSHYNSMMDELTRLYNHRFLREFLFKETKRSIRYNKVYSIIFIDIDDFNGINDKYGRLAGDETLKSVAKILESNLRVEDVAVRYSGDDFVVILPETDKNGAFSFANRFNNILNNTEINAGGDYFLVKVSIGISTFMDDTNDPVKLLEYADKALYRAKYSGKNKAVAYDKDNF